MENIQHYLNIKNSKTKLLSTVFNGSKDLLEWQCECGNTYQAKWDEVYTRDRLICNPCTKKNHPRRLKHEDMKLKFLEYGFTFEDEEVYKTNNQKIQCVDKDGYRVAISWANLQSGKTPYVFSLRFNSSNYIFNINNYFKLNNINCQALRVLKKTRTVWIECKCSCGELFQTNIESIRSQNQYRCLKCTSYMSTLEWKVQQHLIENNIEFVFQQRFDECKMKRALPFDFYLPQYNICIEVDGEQHFKPVSFGRGKQDTQSCFERVQESDRIKTTFCKEQGIKMLRIAYSEFKTDKYITKLKNNIR